MTTVDRPNGPRPPRILAVDDQPANLALVRKILVPAGFEVGEARSGAEALASARERPPDLILLDMHLPDMHGLEVLRRLRESAWGADLKVVAMSALANPEDQRLWLRAGCLGAIEKPITVATFVETVMGFLAAHEGGGELPFALPGEGAERDRLGDILVAAGLTSPDQLTRAVASQRSSGKRLGQILVEQGAVSEDDIAWALSSQLGYPYIFLTPDIIDESAARALPGDFLRQRRVLPILRFGEEMTLAMADPTDQRTVDEVAGRTRLAVKRALALGSNIEAMLDRLFAGPRPATDVEVTAEAQYLQFHLVQALQQDATEIHFDPTDEGQARVRYRLWGDLVDRAAQPAELHAAVLRHLRRLTAAGESAAAVAEARVSAAGHDLYLRAAFLPTAAGPAATVAFYPRRAEVPSLLPLGVSDRTVGAVRTALGAARGLVLIGCADGFLRSTLLHAFLPEVQRGKVWTLETLPIYRRPTLNQTIFVQPEEVPGYLRAAEAAGADLLALDDIGGRGALAAACNVGAVRLILAAHPHDEPAGLLALLVEAPGAAAAAAALRAVVTAQPIRLLCPSCKEATVPETAVPEAGLPGGAHTFVPRGCEACGFTGFRGRRLLTALWVVAAEDRRLLRAGQTEALSDRLARESAEALRAQGRSLVEDGLTSPAELARLVEDA